MSENPGIRSLEAEKAVLGAILQDKDALHAVMDILKPDDFDATAHRRILEAILALQGRGQPPDLVLLSEELRNRGDLDKVGGPAYLGELADSSPAAANVAFYARIVRDKAIARGIVEASRRIIEKAHSMNGDGIDSLTAYAQGEILRAAATGTGPAGAEIRDLVHRTFRGIEERSQKGEALPGLSTGLTGFDALTGGLKPALLYIKAGRPGVGKTAVVVNIARSAAGADGRVVFFSLEMPGSELVQRLLSMETGIDGFRLARGLLSPEEWSRCVRASDALAQLPLVIDDTGGLSIDRLMARARRTKAEKGLALIVVDYLQLVRPSQRWGTREQEVSEVSRSLKALAKELNVPVLATAQLNRGIESRQDKRLNLADLRESGAIEQDADVIAFLQPADDKGDVVELKISKHRQGPTGTVALLFDRKRTQFKDLRAVTDERTAERKDIDG